MVGSSQSEVVRSYPKTIRSKDWWFDSLSHALTRSLVTWTWWLHPCGSDKALWTTSCAEGCYHQDTKSSRAWTRGHFVSISVILDPELSTHLSGSQSKTSHPIAARTVSPFFETMPREENSPGSETVQLSAGLYYMRDTNLPEYTKTARKSS